MNRSIKFIKQLIKIDCANKASKSKFTILFTIIIITCLSLFWFCFIQALSKKLNFYGASNDTPCILYIAYTIIILLRNVSVGTKYLLQDKDTSFLFSLPFHVETIVVGKIASLYLENVLLSFIFVVIPYSSICINNGVFSVLLLILSGLFLPSIPIDRKSVV